MDLEQRIAAELRAELARQERSRQWLARQTGMPVTSIARWLRGPQSPGLNELDAMCRALGVSVADLLAEVTQDVPTPRRERGTEQAVTPAVSAGVTRQYRDAASVTRPLAA
jgi:transcriptional regulator with XRE-family HTH domain